ncbi:MAG: adenylate/guanylate cyclase domain-containing protein [Deltaproteobacteria bacterium]|nr:adenylate/guanylate cyclase domain-containing protein [Deltaproteobacteria bacterium]
MTTEEFHRKLTAILSADVVGYSRLMGDDEAATVKILETYKGVMSSLIRQHRGRIVDSPGDNLLAEFGSVVDTVQCAVSIQKELQARNADLPENRRMEFRIGINLGDVIEEENRIYGDGVNIAARLEALADPGGICVSKTAFEHIESKLPLGYEYLGEQKVKNIAKPVGAYKVLMETRVVDAKAKLEAKAVSFWRRKAVLSLGVIVILAIAAVLYWNFYSRGPSISKAVKAKKPLPSSHLIIFHQTQNRYTL